MVDALKRARQWVTDSGCVVDLHPTAAAALVLVGHQVGGEVHNGNARDRHQAATDAISAAIRDRLFTLESSTEFDYSVYADSLEELQQHIHDEWREGHIGEMTFAHSQALLRADPTQKPRVRERVSAWRLVPKV